MGSSAGSTSSSKNRPPLQQDGASFNPCVRRAPSPAIPPSLSRRRQQRSSFPRVARFQRHSLTVALQRRPAPSLSRRSGSGHSGRRPRALLPRRTASYLAPGRGGAPPAQIESRRRLLRPRARLNRPCGPALSGADLGRGRRRVAERLGRAGELARGGTGGARARLLLLLRPPPRAPARLRRRPRRPLPLSPSLSDSPLSVALLLRASAGQRPGGASARRGPQRPAAPATAVVGRGGRCAKAEPAASGPSWRRDRGRSIPHSRDLREGRREKVNR
ncbi:unnamed protein product [Urochloa humidicola]